MMKFLLLPILMVLASTINAQYVYTIKADSVKITNCDSSELILENHTQGVPGFLFNTGNGRTKFKRGAQKINDSLYLVGADTINLRSSWLQGGNSFGTTGKLGTLDNNHLDFYTNNTRWARLDTIGHFNLDYVANRGAIDAFSLTNTNGTFKWLSLSGDPGVAYISMRPNNPSFNERLRISTGYTSSIETFYYSDLSVKGYYGLDLWGGYGGGAPKGIRFKTTNGRWAGWISQAGNFILGDTTVGDNGSKLQVAGTATFASNTFFSGNLNYVNQGIIDLNAASAQVNFTGDGSVGFSTGTSGAVRRLTINNTGNTGIGTNSPSAQLHTTGTVRFAGLTSDTTQTRIVVSDANGNLYYRAMSSLHASNGILHSSLAENGMINSSLAVNGTLSAQRLKLSQTGWPDYVFASGYQLPSFDSLEKYIKKNSHLPGIPSAAEVEKRGLDVGDNQAALLRKVEELTLYVIGQEKKIQLQNVEIMELKKEDEKLRRQEQELQIVKIEMAELRKLLNKIAEK